MIKKYPQVKSVMDALGGFDEKITYAEDSDMSWRILNDPKQKIVYAPESIVYHDHRATVKGVFTQAMNNSYGGIFSSSKWKGKEYPHNN